MSNDNTNGMATAGFVLALVTLMFFWLPVVGWTTWLLGLVFSAVGLSQAGSRGGAGRGLAIAGLVISLVGVLLLLLLGAAILALFGLATISRPF